MSSYNKCQDCKYGTANRDENIRLTDYACAIKVGVKFCDDTSNCNKFASKQRGE